MKYYGILNSSNMIQLNKNCFNANLKAEIAMDTLILQVVRDTLTVVYLFVDLVKET